MKTTKVLDKDSNNISFLKKVFFDPISIEIKISEELYGVYLSVLNGVEIRTLLKNNYTITKVYPIGSNTLKVIVKKVLD